MNNWKSKVDQEVELNQNNTQKSNNVPNQVVISFNKSNIDGLLLAENKLIIKCVSTPSADVNTQDLNNHKFCFELQFIPKENYCKSVLSFIWDDPMMINNVN